MAPNYSSMSILFILKINASIIMSNIPWAEDLLTAP